MTIRGLLVWNARGGSADDAVRERVVSVLGSEIALEVHALEEGERAEDVSRAAVGRGIDVVIAAGGDGTVSGCAAGVVGTRARLGIVPAGTSNSFGRALGLPTDVDGACAAIASGATRRVDVANVNGHVMVLGASIGFHADTIESTPSEAKSALGKLAYVIRGIQHLGEFESFAVHIETERGATDMNVAALSISNLAPTESFHAQGPPEVLPDDGLLDLTVISADTAFQAIAAGIELAVSALTSTEAGGPHVAWGRCTRALVTATPPQPILVDGDMIGNTPMDVTVVPLGLTIACAPTPAA